MKEVLFSSRIISMQSSTHSSQMNTVGPAISLRTSCCDLPQNEQYNVFFEPAGGLLMCAPAPEFPGRQHASLDPARRAGQGPEGMNVTKIRHSGRNHSRSYNGKAANQALSPPDFSASSLVGGRFSTTWSTIPKSSASWADM